MIIFDANFSAIINDLLKRIKEAIFLPVCVYQVLTKGSSEWLAAINIGSNRSDFVLSHDQSVRPSKRTVEEVAIVINAVYRGKDNSIYIALSHVVSKLSLSIFVLFIAKCMNYIVIIRNVNCSWHVHSNSPIFVNLCGC